MAQKKIGAIIALDGERAFKQGVTSCGKSISALNSEMKLIKAQYEGQENSLEALTKKHEVLSKILEEQKNKEEAVRKGLEHSRASYEKVGTGLQYLNKQQTEHQKLLERLQEEYEAAEKRLDSMVKAGNSSERAMQKQEAAVKTLKAELEKEKMVLADIDSAITKGNRNYETASNRIKDWETKLNNAQAQTIKANAALNRNAAYMKEAAQSADHCAASIDGFGEKVRETSELTFEFADVVRTNLQNAFVDTVKNAMNQGISTVMDFESAQAQLQASTGATAAQMAEYKSVMEDLYSENFGDDINDVAQSMALVKQYTNELNPDKLEQMTESGIAMRDVFGMDLSETIRGVDALVTNMGLSAEDAFDLMAAGAQNGLNKSGELGDNIAEYSQLWGQAGFSAQEMFAILDNGLSSGAYNLDKVNDFVKEFTISLADGRIEENLNSFSTETQNLFRQWQQGKATSKDVFYSVVNDLANAENQQEALTLASNTWSALGEDNAMKVITSLAEVNTAYDDVKGTMESIKDIKYDTLESRFETLGRKFMTEVAQPIAEDALPMIEEGLDFVIDNMDMMISLTTGIAAGVAAYAGISKAVSAYKLVTAAATTTQKGLNAAMNANVFVLAASAIIGAGTALVSYANKAGEASKEVQLLVEQNEKIVESANSVVESLNDSMVSYADNTAEMKAQGEYAKILAERIEEIADSGEISSEQMSVMKGYIAELNNIVPGLNLSYDEQAQKLSLSTEEMYKNIEASQKQIEQQAAQEYAIELIKKRTELEIESIKLQNQASDVTERRNALLSDGNALAYQSIEPFSAMIKGVSDERKEYQELTDAQKANSEAIEANNQAKTELAAEEEAVKQALEEMGVSWDTVTGQVNANTEASEANAQQQQLAADSNAASAQKIADTYTGIREQVSEVLDSQMNMFEKFNEGTQISSETLLENMQSQIDGVTSWADNMALLADRGINEGILQKLAAMGPEGANYVAAFAQMSDEQLQDASEMWAKSLDMKSGVEESVSGMLETYTVALNGGTDAVKAAMDSVGASSIEGLINGLSGGQGAVEKAASDVGQATVDSAAESAGVHSPSWKMEEIGENIDAGLINGINNRRNEVKSTASKLSDELIQTMSRELSENKFAETGKGISVGIAQGIKSSRQKVIISVNSLINEIIEATSADLEPVFFETAGRQVPEGIGDGMRSGSIQAVRAAEQLGEDIIRASDHMDGLYNVGLNLSYGMASGIRSGRSSVINAVSSVCADAVSTARSKLKIHSPSKVFEELGGYTAEGFGNGYEKKMSDVRRSINKSMEFRRANSTGDIGIVNGSGDSSGQQILQLLGTYIPEIAALKGLQVVLDDGTLVGRLVPKMMPDINRRLNQSRLNNTRGMA